MQRGVYNNISISVIRGTAEALAMTWTCVAARFPATENDNDNDIVDNNNTNNEP